MDIEAVIRETQQEAKLQTGLLRQIRDATQWIGVAAGFWFGCEIGRLLFG